MFYNTWIIKNNRRRESIYKFQFNYQTHEQNKTVIENAKKKTEPNELLLRVHGGIDPLSAFLLFTLIEKVYNDCF